MLGKPPTARHSHSINFISKLGIVVIYGGRNDTLGKFPVLSDVWLIKLHNMNYQEVLIGGLNMPNPRCSHASFVNETELIICGGQGEGFRYLKDIEKVNFD